MKNERVFIQIDGNNFYHRLKELKRDNLLSFDYGKFAQFLRRKKEREVVKAKYYIGAIREEEGNLKTRKLMAAQQKLLGRVQKYGFEIGFGHMLKTDSYHEKGVDVLIAVDMLIGAYEDSYDTLILVTSDTDLLPAIEKVRSTKKKVEYIGFSHKPSYGLITHSDIRKLLLKEEVQHFLS